MYIGDLFDSSYIKTFMATHAHKGSGSNRAILNKVASYFDVVSPDNPMDLKDRRIEYIMDIYENKEPNFGLSVKDEYDQEQDANLFLRTPISLGHAPIEHIPQMREYNPEVDRAAIEVALDDFFPDRVSGITAEEWNDDMDFASSIISDALNDIFIDEETLTGVEPKEDPIENFENTLIECTIDNIISDHVIDAASLEALVSILYEPTMEENQEDAPPELMEKEMPY
jgi:hypothetical protein